MWITSVVGKTPVGQISSFSPSKVLMNCDLPELNSPTTTSRKIESMLVCASLSSFLSALERMLNSDWTLIRRLLIRLTKSWWGRASNELVSGLKTETTTLQPWRGEIVFTHLPHEDEWPRREIAAKENSSIDIVWIAVDRERQQKTFWYPKRRRRRRRGVRRGRSNKEILFVLLLFDQFIRDYLIRKHRERERDKQSKKEKEYTQTGSFS